METAPEPVDDGRDTGWMWPASIALGLALVVVMNLVLVTLAVNHAPTIEPSYEKVDHR